MEKIEDIGFGGLKLIQDEGGFKFGVDAIILADFANSFCPTAKTAVDLGTGSGIIPLVLSHKNPNCEIKGVDVQEKAIELAERNAELNGLGERIEFIRCDVNSLMSEQGGLQRSAEMVISNPPYVAKGSGISNESDAKMIARQETTASLEEFVSAAAWTLKDRGHFFLVHRPSRLVDIFYYCRKNRLEPKDIRFVRPSKEKTPNIVLLHCVLGGGRELSYMDDLFVYDGKGNYSSEILEIYEKHVEKISNLCNNIRA